MTTIRLRDAVEADLPAMLAIYNHAVLHTTATFDLEEQTLEQRRVWLSHYVGPTAKYPLIVAEEISTSSENDASNSENASSPSTAVVVGYCCLSQFRTKPAYSKSTELSIYVDEKYRGRGIGNMLMKEILDRAERLGFRVVIAGITAGNDVSVKMHEKFGFELVGRFKEVGFKFGRWLDVLFYQKMIMVPASSSSSATTTTRTEQPQ